MANPFDAACWPEMEISYAYPTQTSAADGPTIQSRSVDTKVPRLIRLSNPTARPVVWRDVEDHAQTMQAKPWPVVLPVLGSLTVKYAAEPSCRPSGPQSFAVSVVLQELLGSAV